MSGQSSPYPNSNGGVPMNLYLSDRQRLDDRLDRMESKVFERLDGLDVKLDDLREDRASNMGSQKERRRLAAAAAGAATLLMTFAGLAGKAAGVI